MSTIGRMITGEGVFTAWVTGCNSGFSVHADTGLDADLSIQCRAPAQAGGIPWADDSSGAFELGVLNALGGVDFVDPGPCRDGEWQYRVGCREATYTSGAAPVWLGVSGG